MPNLAGYGSLGPVTEERINDKITQKFVSSQQGILNKDWTDLRSVF